MPIDPQLHASTDDKVALDALVTRMYAAFCNAGGSLPDLDRLHNLCVPECVITKAVEPGAEASGLHQFIEARRQLLTDGRLLEFSERETDERTLIFGNVASRWSLYAKSGVLNGVPFQARGIKNLQFVKLAGSWRINALAWDDERTGLTIPSSL
jgi:hypothetical protein